MQAHYPLPGELVEGGQLYWIGSPRVRNDDDEHDDHDDRDRGDRDDRREDHEGGR